MATPKPPTLKPYRATADLVIDGDLLQASEIAHLDPTSKAVAAFLKAGKLLAVE